MLTYRELLQREDAPAGSSWGLFGPDDESGSVNFATPERVLAALDCVRTGELVGLDYAVNAFDPPISHHREAARQVIFGSHEHQRDDYLDNLYLQSTTQIDGLRHRRHEVHGFYNHVRDDDVAVGTPTLGVNRWADRGIVGRGVLADVADLLERRGDRLDYANGEAFPVSLVEEALDASGVGCAPGDILLLRTGFGAYYFDELDDAARAEFPHGVRSPGLMQSHETLEWLWDHQFAMVAADNIAVEAVPPSPASEFPSDFDHGLMHQQLIALLGIALGELWALDDLAVACRARGAHDFLVVAKPLYVVGGVGSPANAVAIL